MANYIVKIYNNNCEVYEYRVTASSEAVARMRAMTMYNHVTDDIRYNMVTKVKIIEREKGFV